MEIVWEDDEQDENENPEENKCQFKTDKQCESIAAMTASEKLNAACYRMVNKNSCSQVNCEYSHEKQTVNAVIAATRNRQISDLAETKRLIQAGHQATLQALDKPGAKAVRSSLVSATPP